ncbi:MAG: hypothetical protein WCK63_11680 [Betaproteobacteria bacterium]
MISQSRKHLFEELSKACHPKNKVREILLAAEGLKVARTLVPELEARDFVRAMSSMGLYTALYHRKYVCHPDAGKGGWISRHGIELEVEAAPDGLLMVYLADNPTSALRAMEAEHANADEDFGDLLGIPACCSAHYTHSISIAEQDQNDFILPALDNTEPHFPFNHGTNIAAQYFDNCLISFYPCSFQCAAAARVAMDTHRALMLYDSAWANRLLEAHHDAILYTEYEGIYRLPGARYQRDTLHYDPELVECTLNGVIGSLVVQGDRLLLIGPHHAVVMRGRRTICEINSQTAGFLVFD